MQSVALCCECGTIGCSYCAAGRFMFFVCGTVGRVSVQQVALCWVCGTVGGVSMLQVPLCCE